MRASSPVLLALLMMIPLSGLSAQTSPPQDYDWVDRDACDVFGGIADVGDGPFACRFADDVTPEAGQQIASDESKSE